MAVVRPQAPGGSRGLQVWLIVAFGVAVVFAALFFMLVADHSKLKEARSKAEENLAKVISSNEQAMLGRFYDSAKPSNTMAARMNEEIEGLAKMATGASTPEEANVTAVREKMDMLLKAIQATKGLPDPSTFQGANLHDALRTLHGLYAKALSDNAKLTGVNKQLTDQNGALTTNMKNAAQEYTDGADRMKKGLTELEGEHSKTRAAKNAEVKAFANQVAQIQEAKDANERKLNNRVTEAERDLEARDKAIAVLQDKLDELAGPAVDSEAIAGEPDGQIIQVSPTNPLVYINLGKKHNLTLGMKFVVSNPPLPGQSPEKAKGTIEVASIFDGTAECRIVKETQGNPMVEGDPIANAVYDPRRRLRFTIAGRFDLDYDGRDDVDGYDRVAALIQQWGGQLLENLDERIDFVVIGTKPPVFHVPENATPDQQARQKDQKAKEHQYLALRSEAKALSIPMLTQEQFLRFIGRRLEPTDGVRTSSL